MSEPQPPVIISDAHVQVKGDQKKPKDPHVAIINTQAGNSQLACPDQNDQLPRSTWLD